MSNAVADAAAWLMWHFITHPRHGYSQPHREGNGLWETVSVPDWGAVKVPDGDKDCSKAVKLCYQCLGIDTGYFTYTGNERAGLISTGLFEVHRVGTVSPKDGDILLRSGHTEMVMTVRGRKVQGGFRISERGTIDGKSGDQTGNESTYSALSIKEWTWIIRYVGPDPRDKEEKVTDEDIEKIAAKVIEKLHADTSDPTGRGYNLNDHDHIKWIAAKLSDVKDGVDKLNRTTDPTGRGYELDTHDHVKWIAAKLSDVKGEVDKLAQKLGNLDAGTSQASQVADSEDEGGR